MSYFLIENKNPKINYTNTKQEAIAKNRKPNYISYAKIDGDTFDTFESNSETKIGKNKFLKSAASIIAAIVVGATGAVRGIARAYSTQEADSNRYSVTVLNYKRDKDYTGDTSEKALSARYDSSKSLDENIDMIYGYGLTDAERYAAKKSIVAQNPEIQNAIDEYYTTMSNLYYTNSAFPELDFSNPDTIPEEYIDEADYSGISTVKYETLATLKSGNDINADGKIATDIIFETNAGLLNFSNCHSASDYEEVIKDAYNLDNTTSQAASAILESLVKDNSEDFMGLDLVNAKKNSDIIRFMAEKRIKRLNAKDVLLSSTDMTKVSKTDYTQPNTEERSVQLHISQDYAQIGIDAEKGIDLLEYVEYGNTNLKDALQDAIIAQDLSSLFSSKYNGLSYTEALNQSFKSGKKLYNNLRLLKDRFGNSANLQEDVREAQQALQGQTSEDVASIKELCATAVRQIYDSNEILHYYFQNNESDDVNVLLNIDLQYIISKKTDSIVQNANNYMILLEDVNYIIPGVKNYTTPTPATATPAPTPTPAPYQTPTPTPAPDQTPTPTPATPTPTPATPTPTPVTPTPTPTPTPTSCPPKPEPDRPTDPGTPTFTELPPGEPQTEIIPPNAGDVQGEVVTEKPTDPPSCDIPEEPDRTDDYDHSDVPSGSSEPTTDSNPASEPDNTVDSDGGDVSGDDFAKIIRNNIFI